MRVPIIRIFPTARGVGRSVRYTEQPLDRRVHGLVYNVFQLRDHSYLLVVKVTLRNDKPPERHTIAWLPGFRLPAYPEHVGALVDNDVRLPIIMLREHDRGVEESRELLNSLFWTAERVTITEVWRIQKSE